MKKRPFFWYLFPSFLLLTLICCAGMFTYAMIEFKKLYLENMIYDLKQRAVIFIHSVEKPFENTFYSADFMARHLDTASQTRFTIVLRNGQVIGDNKNDPAHMENHRTRPEIMRAYEGDTGVAIRFSETLKRDQIYVAIPLKAGAKDTVAAVVRVAVPLLTLSEAFNRFIDKLIIMFIFLILFSIVAAYFASRWLSRPLIQLKNRADNFAEGKFVYTPVINNPIAETARLSLSLDFMAQQLEERILTVTKQKNEQNAILSAMVEGVVAVDMEEHIIMINEAAGRMLGVSGEAVKGKWIQESVRNSIILKYIRELIYKKTFLKQQIVFSNETETDTVVEVQGTVLQDAQSKISGVLFVLHDVTDLKKLENMRKDFVANVSHELRTPLTSIKGFVETLIEGNVSVEDQQNFLTIINKQVDRLNSVIEDLLLISRLEKDTAADEIEFDVLPVDTVIANAVDVCSAKARSRTITVVTEPFLGYQVRMNSAMIEQALINLIDNAITYSPEGTTVTVRCEKHNGSLSIAVADQGPGIAREHLPRLFERFYRVDKARSRKMGGTGLGLSIVKHIMLIHNGAVKVESEPGRGSTFTITLPMDTSEEQI